MKTLAIDLECYSDVDIKKCGLYKYAEHAEILLFAYAFDDEPVQVVDFTAGEIVPDDVLEAFTDSNVLKTAYNAAFEMNVLNKAMGLPILPNQWLCTMVLAYTLGLPGGLGNVGTVLGLPEDKQKMAVGKRLIQYFCKPCKPTKANVGRTRNMPFDDIEKWELFKEYNAQDVEAERAIRKKIEFAFPNETERKLWCLDCDINRRGVLVDTELVESAIKIDQQIKDEALQDAKELTGMENPNSTVQIMDWFEQQEGYRPDTVDKKFRAEYLGTGDNEKVKQFFRLKNLLAKTSVKKYEAMQNMYCSDNRVHGMLQFYGAQRTGRWAGRGVQLHNLPQNHLPDLNTAREIVRSCDYDNLKLFYDNPSDVLSQLIRTAFIVKPGHRFIVADFSAIEARVIAWLADEKWRQEAFANGKDIYCESASQMFGVPVVKHGVNGELRAKGKVAELACIAEGELVLTNHGLKPIEEVSLVDKVWDGERFVQHEGVIYKGFRDVIEYEGLRATTDHLVFVEEQSKPVQFGIAAASGLHLFEANVILSGSKKAGQLEHCGKAHVYDIRNAGQHHRYTVSGILVHNCGYGGGVSALKAFGADKMGLSEHEMQDIITKWRERSPHICRMWRDIEKGVKSAIRHKDREWYFNHGIKFRWEKGLLFITLPSGRRIAYVQPRIEVEEMNGYEKESITYMGMIQGKSGARGWGRNYTWGGKLVENVVQSIARDCLGMAMLRLTENGYNIVMHVHDEVILEMSYGTGSLAEAEEIMGTAIPWAPGLLLNADGYETEYYKKD